MDQVTTPLKWDSDEREMREWCSILSKPPSIMPTPLSDFLSHYIEPDIINYAPKYQRRRYRHDEDFACELLKSIILFGFIQPVLLYKIQPGDEKKYEHHEYEVVDGVHRLITIRCFMKGEYIYAEKKRKIMPHIFHDRTKTVLFYKETIFTETWRNLPENKKYNVRYLTLEERRKFDNYEIFIQRITCHLTMDQRRQEFKKIQRNRIITNNDLFKNCTELLVIKYIVDNNLDDDFANICENYLHKDITQYSTQWLLRFWLISIGHNTPDMCMRIKDSEIKRMIESKDLKFLNCSPEQGEIFRKQIEKCANFFDELEDDKIKFSPCAIYAIFVRLIDNLDKNDIIYMRSYMRTLSESETKEQRKIWETKYDEDEIASYFSEFLTKLRNIKGLCPLRELKAPRKSISQKIRNAVWKANFNKQDIGECFVCKTDIFKKASDKLKTWNCGHIVSHHDNGETTQENMKPICFECNQRMKTGNLFEYKQKFYPENM
jgi:hypothetical protein